MRIVLLALLLATPTFAGGLVTRGDLLKKSQTQTTAALNLYVDSTGSDSNACTSTGTSACLTIQGAIDKVPKTIRHPVTVNLGAGNFAGAIFMGFTIDPATVATGAWVQIIGSLANVSPATGTATGTATSGTAGSGSTFGTLGDSGQTWTVNDLRGKYINITGGTGSGQIKPIVSNTGTAVTIAGTWTAPVSGSSTYAIQDQSAVVTSSASSPAFFGVAAAVRAGFIIGAVVSTMKTAGTSSAIDIRQVKFAPTTGIGIEVLGPTVVVHLRTASFMPAAANTAGISLGLGANVQIYDSVIVSVAGASSNGLASTAVGGQITISGTLIRGGGSGVGVNVASGAATSIGLSLVENYTTQVRVNGNPGGYMNVANGRLDCSSVASSYGFLADPPAQAVGIAPFGLSLHTADVSNCIVGVSLSGQGKFALFTSTTSGTGNTTGLALSYGATAQIASTTTMTGTTEISLDSVTYTLAQMRALSPKIISNLAYGTRVYE